jgi:asparagine synthase (glutamine-hydrolysing)
MVQGTCEKYLIRSAFSDDNYSNYIKEPLLPSCVLWRKKEAFSDGVSKNTRSLYEIIQEYTNLKLGADVLNKDSVSTKFYGYLVPETSEQYYYRSIFEEAYPGEGKIIPHFWMPKYVMAKDASARTLDIYQNNEV